MKTLYFDCFAGASGNMILGALIALGIDREKLIEQIKLLDISDFEIEFSNVNRSGISAVYAEVKFAEEKTHRHLSHINKIIENSRLTDAVKKNAVKIFTRLAEAEAKVHGIAVEKVHFHEVGAIDAIVDVVGACVGFEMLGIEKFVCSKIHVGNGFVNMAHGKFPVPPPAVAELLQNVAIYSTDIEGELITPTGAAIISTVCGEFGVIPDLKIEKTGYGAGTREYKNFPNVLRLFLGETDNKQLTMNNEQLTLIETNLDDISPQILGFVMERAFELGALDCWFTPIQMKKNRPATLVSILCDFSKKEILSELLYRETTTLGIRVSQIERSCLPREIVKVATEFGEIDVKIARYQDKVVNAKPEFEQIKKIAVENNLPLREIESAVLRKLENG